jgi:Family of unknown function (DUF6521)
MSIGIYNEFEIIQNELIGVHALHEFVRSYAEHNKGVGPKIYWLFPILPILFNEESVNLIYNRNFTTGSFSKVIYDRKDIFLTLQKRMESLASKTFNCIYVASNSKLFDYDPQTLRLFIIKTNSLISNYSRLSNEYQKIIFSAKRLGAWFAKMNNEELLIYLNIKF